MELNTIVSEVGTLVDIRDVSVNKELSRAERIECIKGILR